MSKFAYSCLSLALILAACGDDENVVHDGAPPDSGPGPDGPAPQVCNPLGGEACMLPWPSSVYMVPDTSTATGFRVDIPAQATPTNINGMQFDPSEINRDDGFSPNAVIVAAWPTGVSGVGLPSPDDLPAGLGPDASVVLLDMDTMTRAPVMAEPDLNYEDPTLRALDIRPLVRLEPGHRYAVAVRKAVKAADGSDLPISPGFQAALDGQTFAHPLWSRISARMPEVFTALETAGVPKTDLVLAWDFVTASNDMLTADLRAMRDQAVDHMAADGTGLTFDATEIPGVGSPTDVYRYLEGTYDGPNFLTDGEADDSILARDASTHLPVYQGMARWNFAALIPRCVESQPGPHPVVVFGHGLFGSGADSLSSNELLQRVANDNCAIFVAGDFIGLTSRNLTGAIFAVQDLNLGRGLIEKLPQGVINFMALARIVRGPLKDSAMFQAGAGPVIDPTRVYYYGASLGGIMGNVYMAYEPDIEIGILGVPGANWSFLFERSLAWPPLKTTMQNNYTTPYVYALNLSLMATLWDRFDPITTAPYICHTSIVGAPQKKIFLYDSMADSLVNNYDTEMLVRSMGVPLTTPSVREPGLIPTVDTTAGGVPCGFTIYDEHPTPVPPAGNLAPTDDNGTHAGVHERAAVQRQVTRFINEGLLFHECKIGTTLMPCDCATGACD